MSRESRRQKLDATLNRLESEFNTLLVSELRTCANGRWGLFGQNDHVFDNVAPQLQNRLRSPAAQALIELGEEITRLRKELGHADEFEPYAKYLEYRSLRSSNAPGEPKLAAQFLRELDER